MLGERILPQHFKNRQAFETPWGDVSDSAHGSLLWEATKENQ